MTALVRAAVALVLLAGTASVACRGHDAGAGASGGAGGGGAGGGPPWSCGTAAGVCSCVRVDVDLGAEATRACAASGCCFSRGAGAAASCTCRTGAAPLDCPALAAALGGGLPVRACPP